MLNTRRLRYLLTVRTVLVLLLLIVSTNTTIAQTSQGTNPQCSPPPGRINVRLIHYLNEWPSGTPKIQRIAMESYTYGVVMGELGPIIPSGPYTGDDWSDEVLKAQSIAGRTFGAYWCEKTTFPNGWKGIRDGAPDQEFRPYHSGFSTAKKDHYIDISKRVRGIYISYDGLLLQAPYNGKLLDAQFRRDVGNPSTSWMNVGYDYLRSVNNPYTIQYNDGPGWPQTPSHGWTQTGDVMSASWYQLLVHYYTGIQMMSGTGYTVNYWNNKTCSGSPTISWKKANEINNDWGYDSPIAGINSDNFCIEWTATPYFHDASDWYTFFLTVDDGFRLYVDDDIILDKWIDQGPTQYSVSLPISSGYHSIK